MGVQIDDRRVDDCERCEQIVKWLLRQELGTVITCPICGVKRRKSRLAIQGEEGRYVDVTATRDPEEVLCTSCGWHGWENELLLARSMSGTMLCPRCENATIRSRPVN